MSAVELLDPRINIKNLTNFETDKSFNIFSEITKEEIDGVIKSFNKQSEYIAFGYASSLFFLKLFKPDAVKEIENNVNIRNLTFNFIKKDTENYNTPETQNIYSTLRTVEDIKDASPVWYKKINLKYHKKNFDYVERHMNDYFVGVPEYVNPWVCNARSYKILFPDKFNDTNLNKRWEKINLNARMNTSLELMPNNEEKYFYIANQLANYSVVFGQKPEIKKFVSDNFNWNDVRKILNFYIDMGDFGNFTHLVKDLAIITASEVRVNESGLVLEYKKINDFKISNSLPIERSFV